MSDAQPPRPVALVTGAGGAIGRAAAAELAAAGFDVCVADLDRSDLAPAQAAVESAGSNCRSYVCDVTNPDLVDATVAKVSRRGLPGGCAGEQRRNRACGRPARPDVQNMAPGDVGQCRRNVPDGPGHRWAMVKQPPNAPLGAAA
jgi:NAD(P)-dependent dehydrogenase (short-subunit alcohol dehydrogenase family)